jgi:hypothetical protein
MYGACVLTWRLLWHFLHCTCFDNWSCNMFIMLTEQDWNHWFGWTQVLCDASESPSSAASKIFVWSHQENVGWYVHCVRNHILLMIHDAFSQLSFVLQATMRWTLMWWGKQCMWWHLLSLTTRMWAITSHVNAVESLHICWIKLWPLVSSRLTLFNASI